MYLMDVYLLEGHHLLALNTLHQCILSLLPSEFRHGSDQPYIQVHCSLAAMSFRSYGIACQAVHIALVLIVLTETD